MQKEEEEEEKETGSNSGYIDTKQFCRVRVAAIAYVPIL